MNHGLTFYDYYDTVNWVKYLYVVLLTESLSYTFFFSIDSEKTHQDFKYDGRPIYKQNISNISAVADLMAFTVCRICNITNYKFVKITSLWNIWKRVRRALVPPAVVSAEAT